MKITLIKILWMKEKIHWNRMGKIFTEHNWLGKILFDPLVIILVSVFHYVFAIAHIIYEVGLFIFANKMFKGNLQRLYITTVKPNNTKNKI